ncbi:group II intron reverse transcriptase/maturase [Streptomyces chiangmaiensis]
MSREAPARFCERRRVRFPPPTLHLLGFVGPKAEAEEIKGRLAAFLRDELKLRLSPEKTLITHARTHKARFLGYDIWTKHNDTWRVRGKRVLNGAIALCVPPETVTTRCRAYQRGQGKPLIRNDLIRTSDHNIVATFGMEYRGYVQYFQMAGNINWLNKLCQYMERSMLSTLAAKHRRPPWIMRERHKSTVDTPFGKRRCFEAVQRTPAGKVFTARFGGIPSVGADMPHRSSTGRGRRRRAAGSSTG